MTLDDSVALLADPRFSRKANRRHSEQAAGSPDKPGRLAALLHPARTCAPARIRGPSDPRQARAHRYGWIEDGPLTANEPPTSSTAPSLAATRAPSAAGSWYSPKPRLLCARLRTLALCSSAARRSTASGTSGGISFRARRHGSTRPNATGRADALPRCPGDTRRSPPSPRNGRFDPSRPLSRRAGNGSSYPIAAIDGATRRERERTQTLCGPPSITRRPGWMGASGTL
jgi:hypothetical protein